MKEGVMNRIAVVAVVAVGLLAACSPAAAPPPPKTAANVVTTTSTPAQSTKPHSDQQINLSADIRAQCDIDDTDRAPKFDFDSSQLATNDRDILSQVARCFTTGPLKGRSMELTGRADPRGEAEYNMNLGEARATSVRSYLANLGVDASRMSETSRGALDATGHDEPTWRKDRRVDISLAR
jgi:peptidoglycan-associated lipoprotein